MSKKSDKKTTGRNGANDGNKPPRLPKRIAGIKLPRELRKSGDVLLAAASSPVGREMLASGLMAVIAGAAAQRTAPAPQPAPPPEPSPEPSPEPGPPLAGPTPIDPTKAGARAAQQFIDLVGGAATAILARSGAERREN